MKGLIDRFAALDRPTALALLLQRAATDSPCLALAKAIARQTVAKLGVERARPTIMNVIKIAGEEIAKGEPRRRSAKRSERAKASAANTAIRDRAEYVQVREELEEIVRQSPERRTIEDEQLFEHCRKKFGTGVTGRLFKEAKSAVIETFSGAADAWNRGGRPTKTSAPQKPPHPK